MTTDVNTSTTVPITTTTHNDTHEGVHLVILHHGLWGHKGHVKFIADQFKERLGDRILVYRAESNESSFTYDGVDICAQRAVQEIHEVVRVIEAGGNIEDLKGQKNNKKNSKDKTRKTAKKNKTGSKYSSLSTSSSSPSSSSSSSLSESEPNSNNSSTISSRNNSVDDLSSSSNKKNKKKRIVTQFSFIGYSLGGLIGRFVAGLLDLEGFFDPTEQGGRGIEPMYFVTVATPHLGIRRPSETTWSKTFNFLSSRMLSRTGEQLQLIDDYIERKPLLLVMSEPEGVFVKALARFKRRVLYCNIRNDRSVPFWTASFSDADPFNELEDMEIQYNNGYSSLIESFEHLDMETLNRLREERAESLKTTSFVQRTAHTLTSIPWKKYALLGLLTPVLPFWILFASTTISYQGLNSRRRTRNWTNESETLQRIREMASTTTLGRHKDDDNHDGSDDNITTTDIQDPSSSNTSSGTLTRQQENESHQEHTVVSVKMDGSVMESRFESGGGGGDDTLGMDETVEVSHSYPELKSVRPLALQPVQVEISRNLNKLEWSKNIVHIDAWNAHASIVVREKRFSNDGGTAAVQHVVDMFKEDGEDV